MIRIASIVIAGLLGTAVLPTPLALAQNSFGQTGAPYSPTPYPGQPEAPYSGQQGQPYPGQRPPPQGPQPGYGMPSSGSGMDQPMPGPGMGMGGGMGGNMGGGMGGGMGMGRGMQQPMPGPGGTGPGLPQQGGSQPGYGPGGGQPGFGGRPGASDIDQLARMEREDFGVRPTSRLHSGPMHGPTPSSIPGGQVITTKGVVALLRRRDVPVLVLDVLGGGERIPGAQSAMPAHRAGSFNDDTQRQFGQYLQQATRGNREHPLVLYCASPQCWMSYNAALRAIKLGYTNVLWYRGGLQFWKQAGQPVDRAR